MNNRSGLDKKQKIAIAVLSIVGVFFIVLWIVQLNQRLADPFAYKGEPTDVTGDQPQEDSSEALKAKDTDLDGLNDWDELNIYKTSPYLDDSDSDSILDGKEIKAGTDPNCPEGKKCSASDPLEFPATSTTSTIQNGSLNSQSLDTLLNQLSNQPSSNTPADSIPTNADQNLLSGKMDVGGLRKALLDSSMDVKILNALTDEQLLQSYKETLGKTSQ